MLKPRVTPHAVRRYAERALDIAGLPNDDCHALDELRRVHGLDIEEIMAALALLVSRGVAAGAAAVTFQGLRYILRRETVVTVLLKTRRRRRPH